MVLRLLNQRPRLKAQIQKLETGATPVLLHGFGLETVHRMVNWTLLSMTPALMA